MRSLLDAVSYLREYDKLANIGEIARRYFAMNAFDGVLTIIGVLMGNFMAGVQEPRIVVSTGLATCVAMGVSGLWGAYLTEAAERKRDLNELSRYTLTDLNQTRIGRASRAAVVVVAVVDGLSPFMAAMIVLTPFFFAPIFPSIQMVYFVALGMALVTLFALGLFLGRVSQGNLLVYGLKTIFAGVISIGISFLLGEWR
ncbi:MAG: VIT1/CCC1 transporter family protein [Anaerolineales bacterium]|jgi:predicted membrane protein (TIGR00267 family)